MKIPTEAKLAFRRKEIRQLGGGYGDGGALTILIGELLNVDHTGIGSSKESGSKLSEIMQ